MTVFKGYAVGLELPSEIEEAVMAFRETIDHAIKGDTPFEQNQLPHITLVRDLKETDLRSAYHSLLDALPIAIEMGKVERFVSPGYDVIVKKLVTPKLKALHDEMCSTFKLSLPYTFSAHITLAFIKPEVKWDLEEIEQRFSVPCDFTVYDLLAFAPDGELLVKDVCHQCGAIDIGKNMIGCPECPKVSCANCIKCRVNCVCNEFEYF